MRAAVAMAITVWALWWAHRGRERGTKKDVPVLSACPCCGSKHIKRVRMFDVKNRPTGWMRRCNNCQDVFNVEFDE